MRVVRVTREEFETESGQVFSIIPPLKEDVTPSEFQKHYDSAAAIVESLQTVGNDISDSKALGCCGEDSDGEKSRESSTCSDVGD